VKSPLTVQGVGEHSQSGLLALVDFATGAQCRSAQSLHPTEEALDMPALLPPSSADIVGAGAVRLQPGGVQGEFCGLLHAAFLRHSLQRRLHVLACAELLQRRVVRQLVLQAQHAAQPGMALQPVDDSSVGRLEISLEDQAAHQLPLREVMAAFDRAAIGQMPCSELHGELRDLFNP
jgi:hypothetical protein